MKKKSILLECGVAETCPVSPFSPGLKDILKRNKSQTGMQWKSFYNIIYSKSFIKIFETVLTEEYRWFENYVKTWKFMSCLWEPVRTNIETGEPMKIQQIDRYQTYTTPFWITLATRSTTWQRTWFCHY